MNQRPHSHTLTELLSSLQRCVERYYNKRYFVTGEISGFRGINQRGHCYFSMIDKVCDPLKPDLSRSDFTAQVTAVIWSSRYRQISETFLQATGQPLGEGVKILAEAEVQYTPRYGLQLIIYDIDPSYTLGELARRRLETIAALHRMGVFDLNRQLALSQPIRRIAVVSSPTAAGCQDFVKQIKESSAGAFMQIVLYRALMQGANAPQSIVAALDRIREHADLFDVVVIIRGGGATSDLSAFDAMPVAQAVAQFPLPVWSGIGHERDESVTDMVSNRSFKTPTAVAAAIAELWTSDWSLLQQTRQEMAQVWRDFYREKHIALERCSNRLQQTITTQLHNEHQSLLNLSGRLRHAPHLFLMEQRSCVKNDRQRLRVLISLLPKQYRTDWTQLRDRFAHSFVRYISFRLFALKTRERELQDKKRELPSQRTAIAHYEQFFSAMHPRRVLRRGYAIVRKEGKAVKNPEELPDGSRVELQLAQGSLDAVLCDVNLTETT